MSTGTVILASASAVRIAPDIDCQLSLEYAPWYCFLDTAQYWQSSNAHLGDWRRHVARKSSYL